jgi:hypothetical protein
VSVKLGLVSTILLTSRGHPKSRNVSRVVRDALAMLSLVSVEEDVV